MSRTAATTTVQHGVMQKPGPDLQTVLNGLPDLDDGLIICIVPHLSLCEALLLPSPFPVKALAHHLATYNGTLDLSPPRVPVFTPEDLSYMCRQLEPLIPYVPQVTGLNIPGPCLQALDDIITLTSALPSLSNLHVTPGHVTDNSLADPQPADPNAIPSLLQPLVEQLQLRVSGPHRPLVVKNNSA